MNHPFVFSWFLFKGDGVSAKAVLTCLYLEQKIYNKFESNEIRMFLLFFTKYDYINQITL